MKEYFLLQWRMTNRLMALSGIQPVVGWPVGAALFIVLSVLLFSRLAHASWIYPALALLLVARLGGAHRNEFILTLFPNHGWKRVRVTENLIAVSPFLLFLLFRQEWLSAVVLVVSAPVLVFSVYRASVARVIPTPFGRFPLEFPSGFRGSWPLWLLSAGVVVMAIVVDNFNLALFALIMLQLATMSFYLTPEPVYDVWVFDRTPARFLWMKTASALVCSGIALAPSAILILTAFPGEWLLIASLLGAGWLLLSMVVMAKYASFPEEISLPFTIIMVLCITFPPLLLPVIPYLAIRAANRLSTWLS